MGKTKTKTSTTSSSSTSTSTSTSTIPPNLTSSFPNLILSSKSTSIQPTTLIPSQVILLPNLLSSKECFQLISHFSSEKYFSLIPSPLPKKGEALRTNSRIGFQDHQFSKRLWNDLGLKDLVEGWESLDGKKKPVGLNGNIRIFQAMYRTYHFVPLKECQSYRYLPTELFGPHYDESTKDESTGFSSEWTLLIYLTGKEDQVEGGETVFYENHSVKNTAIVAPLQRGMGLLHRHGNACMLHEGRPPTKGVKWILRSDLLFG